jgi:glycine oxidase
LKSVDYIIVGQGLAGSAVAVQLLRRGKNILVIDLPSKNNSSRIAAGLFNPVTGKKMVKTWLADKLFPCLHEFYKSVEQHTGTRFFYPTGLYRPFLSIEEQNEWMAKSAEPSLVRYIQSVQLSPFFTHVNDPYGGLLLKQCGYLDTTQYIHAVSSWIRKEGTLLYEDFDFDRLRVGEGIEYGEVRAGRIIFCQGVHANPLFDWLPVRPLKGETITIGSSFHEEVIINRGVYLVPGRSPGEWRAGATYNFQDDRPGVTPGALQELREKLGELVNFPFEVRDQQWGLRPTTPDRRPLLGTHPEHESIAVFNGLGTKGVSLAPYFSEVLIHSIENRVPLNKEVNIERYKSVYWNSPK